ncbi:MAG TPA: hypothetical protein VK992_04555 [Candidatus Caenarcaniphilales bacterium]|nr:hypothetical protein [Candidatus Caenarcaniphilales bacterium]
MVRNVSGASPETNGSNAIWTAPGSKATRVVAAAPAVAVARTDVGAVVAEALAVAVGPPGGLADVPGDGPGPVQAVAISNDVSTTNKRLGLARMRGW